MFEDMCNCFRRQPAYDGQTDGQTDILRWHSPRYACGSRGKKSPFSTNISLYLRNDCKTRPQLLLIGNRTQAFDWYHFQ